MVGLELDIRALRKIGKKAILIAMIGIAVPFAGAAGISSLVRSTLAPSTRIGPLIVFLGAPLAISAFSVLVRIMAELKILSSELGKLAVPAAAMNDVTVWTLLAVGVAIAGAKDNPLTPIWVLLCGAAFALIMFTVVRMFMTLIAHRAMKQTQGTEIYVCITLVGVLLAGFFSDAIGVHPLFGPFLFGLVIPKDNAFPKMIIEKIEDFVIGLMLPLFFASSGLKTDLGALHGAISLGFLLLFFVIAAGGKITGTFVVARLCGLPNRKALILGFLMNTKGLAVLIVLNIGRDLKALTDETFAILVVTCLLTSFVTTPVVTALCRPTQNSGAYNRCNLESVSTGKHELRILACAYENRHYTAMVNLVEASRGNKKSSLKLYTLRLMELSERPSTILALNNGEEGEFRSGIEGITVSFQASAQLSKVKVRSLTALSGFDNMHEDICKLATLKRAAIIILPYHKPTHGAAGMFEPGFHKVNQKVLEHAPCSVGILVDRTSGGASPIHPCFFSYKVVILFMGGADDREALVLGCRMADHPGVALKVVRYVGMSTTTWVDTNQQNEVVAGSVRQQTIEEEADHESSRQDYLEIDREEARKERIMDDEAIAKVKESMGSLVYEEEEHYDNLEGVRMITKSSEVNLVVVGRARRPSDLVVTNQNSAEFNELGTVGEILADGGPDFHACVLVVQHHAAKLTEPASPSTPSVV